MSTTYGCMFCGRDMDEVWGPQVCDACLEDPDLRCAYNEEQREWFAWLEPQLPFDIIT